MDLLGEVGIPSIHATARAGGDFEQGSLRGDLVDIVAGEGAIAPHRLGNFDLREQHDISFFEDGGVLERLVFALSDRHQQTRRCSPKS